MSFLSVSRNPDHFPSQTELLQNVRMIKRELAELENQVTDIERSGLAEALFPKDVRDPLRAIANLKAAAKKIDAAALPGIRKRIHDEIRQLETTTQKLHARIENLPNILAIGNEAKKLFAELPKERPVGSLMPLKNRFIAFIEKHPQIPLDLLFCLNECVARLDGEIARQEPIARPATLDALLDLIRVGKKDEPGKQKIREAIDALPKELKNEICRRVYEANKSPAGKDPYLWGRHHAPDDFGRLRAIVLAIREKASPSTKTTTVKAARPVERDVVPLQLSRFEKIEQLLAHISMMKETPALCGRQHLEARNAALNELFAQVGDRDLKLEIYDQIGKEAKRPSHEIQAYGRVHFADSFDVLLRLLRGCLQKEILAAADSVIPPSQSRSAVHSGRNQPDLPRDGIIISRMNQYQAGGQNMSLCSSCAVAFLAGLKQQASLQDAMEKSIPVGRAAHEAATKATKSPVNTNFNAQQIIQHGRLGLRELGKSVTGRPTSLRNVSRHYRDTLIPALLDKARVRNGLTLAIFTKVPLSSAIACRHLPGGKHQFFFFDSHGEIATNNLAFVRTFNRAEGLCDYLANRYGFDAEFPNVDFDLDSGQDNPNNYELTFVE